MIRHLAVSHEVTVATLARTADEMAAGQELHRYCHDLHVGRISKPAGWARFALYGMSAAPATFGYFYLPELARTVKRLLDTRGFDAIVVHCSSMGPYVAGHAGCRKVMDFGDADSEKWLEDGRTAPHPRDAEWGARGVLRATRAVGPGLCPKPDRLHGQHVLPTQRGRRPALLH